MPTLQLRSMSTNFTQTVICLISGFFCLLPLLLRETVDFTTSPLHDILTSLRFRDTALFAMAVTLPSFLDIMFEMLLVTTGSSHTAKMSAKKALLNTNERFLLYCGIMTIPITAFLPANTASLVNIYLCLTRSRTMFVLGAVFTSLGRYDSQFWSVGKTYFLISLCMMSSFCGSLADNTSPLETGSVAHSVSSRAHILLAVVYSYCYFSWIYYGAPTTLSCLSRLGYSRNDRSLDRKAAAYSLFPFLYATVTYGMGVLSILTAIYFKDAEYSSDSVFTHNLNFIIYLMVIMYISEKMLKDEIVQGLYALIESKKSYVRYISHELRTPLNSAFLGLKIVCDDLEVSTNVQDLDRCETLLEVRSACRTAVEILNDLLCFDKLESGILELHKHDVAVIPFIENCADMFASQAKEAGITILMHMGQSTAATASAHQSGALNDLQSGKCIQIGDTAYMDKFKMDQVLRNLISNALKFTPRGGSISVCASFIPDRCNREGNTSRNGSVTININENASGLHNDVREVAENDTGLRFESDPGSPDSESGLGSESGPRSHFSSDSLSIQSKLNSWMWSRTPSMARLVDDVDGVPISISSIEDKSASSLKSQGVNLSRHCGNDKISYSYSSMPATCDDENTCGDVALNNVDVTAQIRTGYTTGSSDHIAIQRGRGTLDANPLIRGRLRLVVADSGAGISIVDQQRLFKEIVQFNPEVLQAGGGSGLGLWITSSIVKMHGGSISVHSEGVGLGSTFTVEIEMMQRQRATPAVREGAVMPLHVTRVTRHLHPFKQQFIGSIGIADMTEADEYADMQWCASQPQSLSQSTTIQAQSGIGTGTEIGATSQSLVSTVSAEPPSPHGISNLPASPREHLLTKTLSSSSSSSTASSSTSSSISNSIENVNTTNARTVVQDPGSDSRLSEVFHVLVVDDSSLNRKMLCKLLRGAKHICEEADDGLAAVEKVKSKMLLTTECKKGYDAILMDFVMPVMDGPTATRIIRDMGYNGVIFGVTGNTLDGDINFFMKSGVDAVIPKPFDFNIFKELMKNSRKSVN